MDSHRLHATSAQDNLAFGRHQFGQREIAGQIERNRMPRSVESLRQFVETFVDDQSALGDPADDDATTLNVQSHEPDVSAGLVLDRQNGSALFGSERELDRLVESRRRSIDPETRVLDGAVDSVKGGTGQTLVAVVQVMALAANWALMNGAKFQLGARFPFESRRADAPL